MENGIRLRAIGDLARLPDFVRKPLMELMADSAGNSEMSLTLALSYGGRESIVGAVNAAIDAGAKVDEESFGQLLPTAALPPLDLLVRTSGELRISNFLLWEAAYAELVFFGGAVARISPRSTRRGARHLRQATTPLWSNGSPD